MKIAVIIVIMLHSLVHLLGFMDGFHLFEVRRKPQPIAKLEGSLWLLTMMLLAGMAILILKDNFLWWYVGGAGLILSQSLIIQNWTESKWGTLPNVMILAFLIRQFV